MSAEGEAVMRHITTPAPETVTTFDERELRRSLGSFPTGVCIVTTMGPNGKREGMTINSFSSLSLTPPLILWSVRNSARSAATFLSAPHFIINVLSKDQKDIAQHFAHPAADKFDAYESMFDEGLGGCPRLTASVSIFECDLHSIIEQGDHCVLIGRIQHLTSNDVSPLIFHAGRMGSLQELAPGAAI
jgi:flavin reductase (DIM6/NTAB) family NADH-FMN oxidoreductase RutF